METPSEDGAVRPQTLMLTLLGRYLLGRDVAVSAASVIEVFARVGVGEHAARSTLTRMVNRQLLTRQRHGRAMYFGLTDRSERILRDGEARLWKLGAVNRDWDGVWTLLGFSLPESWQRQRHELRSQLAWAGFGPLFNGLWVAPGRAGVEEIVGALGLESHVKAFHSTTVPGTDVDQMIRETWDLDAIAAPYLAFTERWKNVEVELDGGADPLAVKLMMNSDWLRVIRGDPRLPLEHLPADWPAAEAEALFVRVDRRVDGEAARIAAQLLDVRPLIPSATA
ncbi:MAG TPA: PaaX family transcriptional regulator C-terminal domain-containing protein [Actinospica sp.]|nr:PaaX family transcriptional regulator C-terminal domain-containing protein [Actinospica sp.]